MIIQPKIRGPVCLTVHPEGCAEHVRQQIAYVQARGPVGAPEHRPRKVLVIGASTGFGLATRVVTAFGGGASTVGVFYERPASEDRTASPGWYNSAAFEEEARRAGLDSWSLNGDAFTPEIKEQTLELLRRETGPVDLLVYSLAAPRRTDPRTGEVYTSTLKPIGRSATGKTMNVQTGQVYELTLEPATEEEIRHTVSVMGGEDWRLWVEDLRRADLLAPEALTVAYSYIGPELTRPIYREGTIGRAKEHLEATAGALGERAFVSVNKALVTQASAAIPFVPLYIALLYRVMKNRRVHEGAIEQMDRLFRDELYGPHPPRLDEKGRIRLDDRELDPAVQAEVRRLWDRVSSANLNRFADLQGYREELARNCGFGLPGVDYEADVDPRRDIPSL